MISYEDGPRYRIEARAIARSIHHYYDLEKKIANPKRSDFLKDGYREQRSRIVVSVPRLIANWNETHGEERPLHWSQYTEGLFWSEVRRYREEVLGEGKA